MERAEQRRGSPPGPSCRDRGRLGDDRPRSAPSTSRLSFGEAARRGSRFRPAASAPRRCCATSARVFDARRDWRPAVGGVEQRERVDAVPEHRDAERLEQLHRCGDVEQRLDARRGDHRFGARAQAPRSAETSGGVGKPRWTPPRPPVPMNRISTAAAAASVPPTVVAPTSPGRRRRPDPAGRASARPGCTARARPRSARSRCARRGRRSSRGRHRARRHGAASLASPTSIPAGAGKPWATSVVSSATTGRPSPSAASTSSATLIRCSTRAA